MAYIYYRLRVMEALMTKICTGLYALSQVYSMTFSDAMHQAAEEINMLVEAMKE